MQWQGRCPGCSAWHTLEEQGDAPDATAARARAAKVVPLGEAAAEPPERAPTGSREIDRVLGGGVVPGGVVLLGGDPGIGKSTLLLQVAARWIATGRTALYVAGEESPEQIALRAARLGRDVQSLPVCTDPDVDAVAAAMEADPPDLVIVDSIQTLRSSRSTSAAGSVPQLRDVTTRLTDVARARGIATILVGHVTRSGAIAGPRVVEHLVDTVLYLEGEPGTPLRTIRPVKNRFGSTLEVALLAMGERGLRDAASDIVAAITTGAPHGRRAVGVAIGALLEGTRSFPVEVQALAADAAYGPARLTTNGVDSGRVQMLAAILERYAGDTVAGQDLYLNIVGGLRLTDPTCDLAVLASIASSLRRSPLSADVFVAGEVGLTGELRPVAGLQARLLGGSRAGFRHAVVPESGHVDPVEGLTLHRCRRLEEALEQLFDIEPRR